MNKKFKEMINEGSSSSELLKIIKKEFDTYGWSSGKNYIEEYFKEKIEDELNEALRKYFKTTEGIETIESWLEDNSVDEDEWEDEIEWYQDRYRMQVEKLSIVRED